MSNGKIWKKSKRMNKQKKDKKFKSCGHIWAHSLEISSQFPLADLWMKFKGFDFSGPVCDIFFQGTSIKIVDYGHSSTQLRINYGIVDEANSYDCLVIEMARNFSHIFFRTGYTSTDYQSESELELAY
uniref:Uncharacterized protein n=1 Tax=Cannabis sativa TaxID=3483 RepID=A0A803R2G8_CANSA